ncbi:transporter [Candidatus Bathyarchaeota archaeon]|nr:transporter [Candidatus Bathyarchaeota archaeon]
MTESVYKFVELVGTSEESWEDAVNQVVDKAAESLRDLRIAEVIKLDAKIDNQKIALYRAKVKLSFKFEE